MFAPLRRGGVRRDGFLDAVEAAPRGLRHRRPHRSRGRPPGRFRVRFSNSTNRPIGQLAFNWAGRAVSRTGERARGAARRRRQGPALFTLAQDLAPGEAAEVKCDFTAARPPGMGGGGAGGTGWHPQLWWGAGRLDDYEVKIGIPAGFAAATSGRLENGVYRARNQAEAGPAALRRTALPRSARGIEEPRVRARFLHPLLLPGMAGASRGPRRKAGRSRVQVQGGVESAGQPHHAARAVPDDHRRKVGPGTAACSFHAVSCGRHCPAWTEATNKSRAGGRLRAWGAAPQKLAV